MAVRPSDSTNFSFRLLRTLFSVVGNSLAVLLLLLLFGATQAGTRFFEGLRVMLSSAPPEAQVDVRTLVVQQIRGASELTTAIFVMEAVVPASRDRTVAGYVVGKTTLLYIAYGEVRAGVDLSEITPEAIQTSGETIQVQLPPPKILDSKIDVTRSRVYDYDRGFLSLGPDAAPELQTLAQQETLEKIVAAACEQQVLVEANLKAELAVTQLLETAGYQNITVETQDPVAGTCSPIPES